MAIASQEGSKERIDQVPMMERILLFIKHRLKFIWRVIEEVNGFIFILIYGKLMEKCITETIEEYGIPLFKWRRLAPSDVNKLFSLISSQKSDDIRYFRPHDFDLKSIKRQLKKNAFLMMGVFKGDNLIGYFFLRFFINRSAFVGRLIDEPWRGKGIGPVMNEIMYETVWRMNFRCLSTISRDNHFVMRAHAKNRRMVIVRELENNYLLVEFLR